MHIDETDLFEVKWCTYGWKYTAARIYDKRRPNTAFKRFMAIFGYRLVHEVTCTTYNGFDDYYSESDIKMMTKTEYNEKIEKPALAHYKKYLAVLKTWK